VLVAATLLSGCSLFSPPLRSPQPVDPTTFAGVPARAGGSVGRLLSTSCAGAPMAGSGFVVDAHHVLTASHVVGGARQVSLRLTGAAPVLGEIVGIDATTDTALVRTTAALAGPPLELAGAGETTTGTEVEALGYPLGDAELGTALARLTSVSESAVVNDHPAQDLLVVDATLRVGMSGGPVVDAQARVRGMVVAAIGGRGGRDSTASVALALPTALLAGKVEAWRTAVALAPDACAGEASSTSARAPGLTLHDGADAEVAHTLWLLGSSLNAGQYPSAWGMLTAGQQGREGELAAWISRTGGQTRTEIEVLRATRDGDRATAQARVRSTGADGSCRSQAVGYQLRLERGIWLIDGVDADEPAGC